MPSSFCKFTVVVTEGLGIILEKCSGVTFQDRGTVFGTLGNKPMQDRWEEGRMTWSPGIELLSQYLAI